jgi:hypothetical protein
MVEDDIDILRALMTQAVADQDFEAAARLRDRITALGPPDADSLFQRQTPGRMGLGTDQQVYRPPSDWRPPKKPDPMTSNTKPRRGGR